MYEIRQSLECRRKEQLGPPRRRLHYLHVRGPFNSLRHNYYNAVSIRISIFIEHNSPGKNALPLPDPPRPPIRRAFRPLHNRNHVPLLEP